MRKQLLSLAAIAMVLLLASCSSTKNVAYFQNVDEIDLAASRGLFDARIMPKDQLTITVNCTDPVAALPFNLIVKGTLGETGQISTTSGSLQTYLVDNEGNIDFPVLGKLKVMGRTKTECQDMIRKKVEQYLAPGENPVVTVKMSSYRVTVSGEVNSPRVVPVTTEKMSILEALASAGDLTIYGRRDNVLLIREDETGEKHAYRLNLNDANLINSEYYYVQQNDYIYVEPNKVKAQNSSVGSMTTLWFSATSILISLTSLLYNILK